MSVSAASTITMRLQDPAGVIRWRLQCISTDPHNDPTAVNSILNISDPLNHIATLVMPSIPSALMFESVVNDGININNEVDPALTSRFMVHVPTAHNFLVAALNETIEANARYGTALKLDAVIRAAGGSGDGYDGYSVSFAGDLSGNSSSQSVLKIHGATVPIAGSLSTGTVLQVSGSSALSYALLANANVSASAAIAGSKISPIFGAQNITNTGTITASGIIEGSSYVVGSSGPTLTKGTGAPAAAEPAGSIYLRTNGTSSTGVYTRQAGAWTALGGGGGSSITWAGDLAGSSDSSQVAVSLTGAAGVVPIAATGNVLTWAAATTAPGLKQTTTGSASGAALTLQAQNALTTGGAAVITSGTGATTAGSVKLQTGGVDRLTVAPSVVSVQPRKTLCTGGTKFLPWSDYAEVATTTATPATIYSFALSNNVATQVDVVCIGNNSATTLSGTFKRSALFRNKAGVAAQIGTTVDSGVITDGSGWNATVSFTGTTCFVKVIGAATPIQWGVFINVYEVQQ